MQTYTYFGQRNPERYKQQL